MPKCIFALSAFLRLFVVCGTEAGGGTEVLQALCLSEPFRKALVDPAGMQEETFLQGLVQEYRLFPEGNGEPLTA